MLRENLCVIWVGPKSENLNSMTSLVGSKFIKTSISKAELILILYSSKNMYNSMF